jgi:cell division septum initiation protein DivIVA
MREEMEYINGVLEELEAIVHNASSVPMRKGRALVDRSDIVYMLEELRESLPGELSDAESVRRECSAMVAAAEEEAGRILEKARERADGQVEHTDAYLRAQRRAAEIHAAAEEYSKEVSSGSEAYRERIMGQLEGWCQDSLTSVEESRKELNSAPRRAPSAGLSDDEDEAGPDLQANTA